MQSNGEINMLSTEYSNSIEDIIDAYLKHENSYPAFLSAVTIDLFNRQTMAVEAASRDRSSPIQSHGPAPASDEEEESDGGDRHEGNAEDDGNDENDEEEPMDSDSEGEVGPRVNIPGDDDDDDDDEDDDEDDDDEEEEDEEDGDKRGHNRADDGSDDDLICLD
jgi:hypothetical protein